MITKRKKKGKKEKKEKKERKNSLRNKSIILQKKRR